MARRTKTPPPPPVVLSKAEKYASALESLDFYENDLREKLERERKDMAAHASKLIESKYSPQYEMEWGDKLFATAAQIDVLTWLFAHRAYEDGTTIAWRTLRDYMLEEACREGRSTSMSTGQSHNLAARHKMAAQFELCERGLNHLVKCEAKCESLAFELQAEGVTVTPEAPIELVFC